MAVSNVSSASQTPAAASDYSARVPQKTLGQKDFLQLIATQLTHQDPMKPMEDTAFIAQMAQFSSLENSQKMLNEFSSLRSSGELSFARSLIGQEVTVFDSESKKEVTGNVEALAMDDGSTALVIDGKSYELSSLRKVKGPAVEAEAQAPSTAQTVSEAAGAAAQAAQRAAA